MCFPRAGGGFGGHVHVFSTLLAEGNPPQPASSLGGVQCCVNDVCVEGSPAIHHNPAFVGDNMPLGASGPSVSIKKKNL